MNIFNQLGIFPNAGASPQVSDLLECYPRPEPRTPETRKVRPDEWDKFERAFCKHLEKLVVAKNRRAAYLQLWTVAVLATLFIGLPIGAMTFPSLAFAFWLGFSVVLLGTIGFVVVRALTAKLEVISEVYDKDIYEDALKIARGSVYGTRKPHDFSVPEIDEPPVGRFVPKRVEVIPGLFAEISITKPVYFPDADFTEITHPVTEEHLGSEVVVLMTNGTDKLITGYRVDVVCQITKGDLMICHHAVEMPCALPPGKQVEIRLKSDALRKEFWSTGYAPKEEGALQKYIRDFGIGKFELLRFQIGTGEKLQEISINQSFLLGLEAFKSASTSEDGRFRPHAWMVCDYRLVPQEGAFVEKN